jgi:hypothetical protein
VRKKTQTQLGPFERANLNHWASQLRMETDPVSETSCFLFSRIPDDGEKSKNLVILCVIHHRQSPLESLIFFVFLVSSNIRNKREKRTVTI